MIKIRNKYRTLNRPWQRWAESCSKLTETTRLVFTFPLCVTLVSLAPLSVSTNLDLSLLNSNFKLSRCSNSVTLYFFPTSFSLISMYTHPIINLSHLCHTFGLNLEFYYHFDIGILHHKPDSTSNY